MQVDQIAVVAERIEDNHWTETRGVLEFGAGGFPFWFALRRTEQQLHVIEAAIFALPCIAAALRRRQELTSCK